ncbi:MAG TPA: NotI family restriction endonuclease [Sedimentisphaerales bacterium]|nr:NotI family restriction endonuclease [Sedimentisphaerales bacterium]
MNHPLAEVFGYSITDFSEEAVRFRHNRLCPFNNKVPSCTKDKANNPLGVCSIYNKEDTVITCPVRFREGWIIAEDAASFFFPPGSKWTSLTEVRLKDKAGKSAGNINVVLVSYDDSGKVTDFGVLEVQAVYISGNVRNPFEDFISGPAGGRAFDWTGRPNYPTPDYLSSSRKRLAPQLIFKGGILDMWGKKTAVALNRGVFEAMTPLQEVEKHKADVAWLIYDLRPSCAVGQSYEMFLERVVYTKRPEALGGVRLSQGQPIDTFINQILAGLEEIVV